MGRKAGAGIAIAAGLAAFTGGATLLASAALGITAKVSAAAFFGTMAVYGGVGAAVGALGLLIPRPKGPKTRGAEIEQTSSIRDRRVPFVFGRARCEGNYVHLGGFGGIDTDDDNVPGKLRVIHAIVALCEGAVQAMGNLHVAGFPVKQWAKQFGTKPSDDEPGISGKYRKFFRYFPVMGTNAETNHAMVMDPVSRFGSASTGESAPDPGVPYRNTAQAILHMVVGVKPQLIGIHADIQGPSLRRTRSEASGEGSPGNVTGTCGGYDAYSRCYWHTLASSATVGGPFGLVRIGRELTPAYAHTAPPASVTASVTRAWYLGRHDIVVMQDPVSPGTFHFGYWGIARDSLDWEGVRMDPSGGYDNTILTWHLDELHGILHTLHNDGIVRYVMRMHLLTGWVERVDTALAAGTFVAMMYSPALDTYVVADSVNGLFGIDPIDGSFRMATSLVSVAGCVGLCVSGHLVGVVTASGVRYFDVFGAASVGTFGDGGTGLTKGAMGGTTLAQQNTYTNHVALLGKQASGTAAFVGFHPSVTEAQEDVSALGTQGEPEFQTYVAPSVVTDWVRNWSYRQRTGYSLVSFDGNSSLAGAAWMACVDEAECDSGRWGAGMREEYFDLSAFEALDGYCLGAMKFKTPKRLTESGAEVAETERWAERAKFDYLLDREVSAAHLVGSEILGCVNGHRAVREGRLAPEVMRRGALPIWHFTEAQIVTDENEPRLGFVGAGKGTNRIRVRFVHVRGEYRSDFAEANDEQDQDQRGRVQEDPIDLIGIGRYEHAAWLARQTMDQYAGGRRRIEFKTHFRAMILAAGDVVKITHASLKLDGVLFRIMEIKEQSNPGGYVYSIVALEHPRVRDAIKQAYNAGPTPFPDDGDTGSTAPTAVASAPSGAGGIVPFDYGTAWAAGMYKITHLNGAFRIAPGGDFCVSGADVVTIDSAGVVVVLAAAPGSSTPFPSLEAAEDASAGSYVVVTLVEPGMLGITLQAAFTPAEGFVPRYQVQLVTPW